MLTPEQLTAYRQKYGLQKAAPTAAASTKPANKPALSVTPTATATIPVNTEVPQNTWLRTAKANPVPAGQTAQPVGTNLPANNPPAPAQLPSWYTDLRAPSKKEEVKASHQADREKGAKELGIPLIENDTRANGVQQGFLKNIKPGFDEVVVKPAIEAARGGINQIKEGGAQVNKPGGNPLNLISGVGKIGAGAVSTIFSPLAAPLKPVNDAVEFTADKISDVPAVQKFADTKAGQATARISEDVANYSAIAGAVGGVMDSLPGLKNKAISAKTALSDIKTKGVIKLNDTFENFGNNTTKTAAKNATKAETATGQVIQGETADIPAAQRSLSQVEVPKKPTYENVAKSLDEKIAADSKLIDEATGTNPTKTKLTSLDKTIKAGDETVTQNPVRDALTQLSDFYKKVNQTAEYARVKNLAARAENEGLTITEINKIAREHGQMRPAFNANGELASGLSKQAFENTRKGVKAEARALYGDEALENLDHQISDTIRTKELMEDMAHKVQQAKQKIPIQSWYKKAGSWAGRGLAHLDDLVGGAGGAFVRKFMGFGKDGATTLDAIGLENALKRNLQEIQKLYDPNTTGAQAEAILKKMVEDNALDTTPLPKNKPKVAPTSQTIKPADLQRNVIDPEKPVKVNNYQEPKYNKYVPQTSDKAVNTRKIVESQLGDKYSGFVKNTQLPKSAKNQATRRILEKLGNKPKR